VVHSTHRAAPPHQPQLQWDPSHELARTFMGAIGNWLGAILQDPVGAGGGGHQNVPLSQRSQPNPQYQAAAGALQSERQVPPQQAQARLERLLAQQGHFTVGPPAAERTTADTFPQGDRVSRYRAELAMQQLMLSAGLGQRAVESAELGHLEQASWLARQSFQALQGGWVEAAPPGALQLPQVNVPQPTQVTVVYDKYAAAVQAVQKRFDEAQAAQLKWHEKEEEVQEAEQILKSCQHIRQDVQRQVEARAASSQSAEQQASDEDILAEALAAEQQARENLEMAEDEANEFEASFNELGHSAEEAADGLGKTRLEADPLDAFLNEFGGQDDQQ